MPYFQERVREDGLLDPVSVSEGRVGLELAPGWQQRWSVVWRLGGEEVCYHVGELVRVAPTGLEPLRWFSWHRGHRHRPGLKFLVSTGRQHGFESLEEAQLLLTLDFAGEVFEMLPQPLRLVFGNEDGQRDHTPDFLVLTRTGVWLIDSRPADLIKEKDRESFAAAAELALARLSTRRVRRAGDDDGPTVDVRCSLPPPRSVRDPVIELGSLVRAGGFPESVKSSLPTKQSLETSSLRDRTMPDARTTYSARCRRSASEARDSLRASFRRTTSLRSRLSTSRVWCVSARTRG